MRLWNVPVVLKGRRAGSFFPKTAPPFLESRLFAFPPRGPEMLESLTRPQNPVGPARDR